MEITLPTPDDAAGSEADHTGKSASKLTICKIGDVTGEVWVALRSHGCVEQWVRVDLGLSPGSAASSCATEANRSPSLSLPSPAPCHHLPVRGLLGVSLYSANLLALQGLHHCQSPHPPILFPARVPLGTRP